MNRIDIRFIPGEEQRYDTVGDWWFADDCLHIRATGDEPEALLIALHELVEAYLCKRRGVSQEAVDAHDWRFQAELEAKLHPDDAEPGDDPRAPYRREHRFSMLMEMLLAHELGLDGYGICK